MITTLPISKKDFLAVRVTHKFTQKDLEIYRGLVTERIEQYGQIRLYFEMENFEGWELSSFFENAIFDLFTGSNYGRVVMVGNKEWQKWAAKAASPVKKEGIRYFDLSEREVALQWVLQENEKN